VYGEREKKYPPSSYSVKFEEGLFCASFTENNISFQNMFYCTLSGFNCDFEFPFSPS